MIGYLWLNCCKAEPGESCRDISSANLSCGHHAIEKVQTFEQDETVTITINK